MSVQTIKTLINATSIAITILAMNLLPTPTEVSNLEKKYNKCPISFRIQKLELPIVARINYQVKIGSRVRQCIKEKLRSLENIVLIDRENEDVFLKELVRQEQLPILPQNKIPIGELTPPTHIITILQDEVGELIKISEISSGKELVEERVENKSNINYLYKHILPIWILILGTIIYLITKGILNFLAVPIIITAQNRQKRYDHRQMYKQAIILIEMGHYTEGIRELIECSKLENDLKTQKKSLNAMRRLKEINNGY
ncbi:MAG: hypothetical protein KAG61_04995 [Bacteriovoracaceae bacterium]|nr:hypothetical protein [Bacteriovoracaceae bacterium]